MKYYFISAAVFTVLTIALPIVYLPLYQFLVRSAKFHPDFPEWVQFTVVSGTFVLNLFNDILDYTYYIYPSIWFVMPTVVLICLPITVGCWSIISRFWRIRSDAEKRHSFIMENRSRLLFYAFALVSCCIGAFMYSFVEIPAYILYAYIICRRYWRKNKAKQDPVSRQATVSAPV
jgi:hypothetical protein